MTAPCISGVLGLAFISLESDVNSLIWQIVDVSISVTFLTIEISGSEFPVAIGGI